MQLSMDRVQVYPDGELNIQAVTSGPQGNRASTQQHSQPSSPYHRRSQSPQRAQTQTVMTDAAAADISMKSPNPRLRIKTGAHSAAGSPSASLGGMGSLTGSPTKIASAGGSGAFFTSSPKAAGFNGGSPLRQPGQRAVSAAAAAAAAVVGGRVQGMQHSTLSVNTSPVKGAMMGGDLSAMGYSPIKGEPNAVCPGCLSRFVLAGCTNSVLTAYALLLIRAAMHVVRCWAYCWRVMFKK